MKKRKLLLLIFVLFIVIIFLFNNKSPEKEFIDLKGNYLFENPENYVVIEKNGTTLLQNKSLDFSFEILSSWTIEGFKEDIVSGVLLLSPEYQEEENSSLKGCKIIITVYREDTDYLYLKELIDLIEKNEVSQNDATIIKIAEYPGYGIGYKENSLLKSIRIPVENRIYSIEGHFSQDKKDSCEKIYDNLVTSISF